MGLTRPRSPPGSFQDPADAAATPISIDPRYEALVTRIHDETLKAGRKLGGPQAWKDRPGFTFFQGPGETNLIQLGVKASLGATLAPATRGVAPIEGAEHR